MLARLGSRALKRSARMPQVKASVVVALDANRSLSSKKSWVPNSDEKLQAVTMKSLIHEVSEQQRELAAKVVPWFLRNMPAAYFRQIPENLRSQHIKAITVMKDLMQSDLTLKIQTKLEDDSLQITYIDSSNKAGLLSEQINSLVVPKGYELSKVNVFSSLDGGLALNIFFFSPLDQKRVHATAAHAQELIEFVEEVKAGKHSSDPTVPAYSDLFSPAAINDFVGRVIPSYIANTKPKAIMLHRNLFEKVRSSDGTVVTLDPYHQEGSNATWVTIAAANVLPEVMLRQASSIMAARGMDISRAHLDKIDAPESSVPEIPGYVMLLRLLVSPTKADGPDLNTNKELAATVQRDLGRAKWLDNATFELGLFRHPWVGLEKAEVITALCSMLHGPLFKKDPNTFASIKSIIELVSGNKKYIEVADSIAALFLDRFNPNNPLTKEQTHARVEEIRTKLSTVQVEGPKLLLNSMLEGVLGTYRTNYYNPNRYALSLRLAPHVMVPNPTEDRPSPFGVFFIHGRNFNAFHNRFRDIARGGLRLVTPANSDQYAIESTRQYDEVYGLSYAQQLKNKDIPEGGSKGVILVNTPGMNEQTRFFAMRKAVKAFSDALLDLIVKDSVKNLVDFYGKDELIYLGPDEQIIPSDIEWIIQRAGERGYPIPAAFMSSKKDDGFNHKEFGVTSEGVVVYLDVALKQSLNIDPRKQPFTVKVTGGPDGDVAGNLFKILIREYGKNAKIVAIADGGGVAEDPEGLDHDELLRLFYEGKPIDHFNPAKLSSRGICKSATTEEGQALRNTMHFRVKSDVFVPGGGRPNTININNYKSFIDAETGKPSSPLIVEGANLFLTAEARKKLFEEYGVQIVKDSSANKCGVITSSCEVACSMLLTKSEFMAIKPELVHDVLERLRLLARLEGELLFREFHNYPGALPDFSQRISMAIARVTDAITDALADVEPEDPLFKELVPVIAENLPKKLADVAGDRISSKLPVQYQRNAIASGLASKLVYQEGIHLVETQPLERLAQRAFAYYRMERNIKKMVDELQHSDINGPASEHKPTIIDILKRGGVRTSLGFF